MIDTHAHVHDKQYDADLDEVVARARRAGVSQIVTVGCDLADSQRALEVARNYRIYSSVGIHPHEAKDAPPDISAVFAPFLADRRVIAIGETGLDYYYDHSPRDAQQRVFRQQIALAREAAFPVIFHQRDAYDDFISILREEWRTGMRGVVHCFSGDARAAHVYVEEFGLFLGIGGVVTFKNAQALRDAVCSVGLAALVLETDCPYLAPIPHRGKRNEPSYVEFTAQKVAELFSIAPDEVGRTTDANALSLFDIRTT
jgi:TatD DNase family protein